MRQALRSALLLIFLPLVSSRTGLLHPQTSESREVQSLDGLWRFNVDVHAAGLREGWHMSGLPHGSVPMAVPSSYNDLLENTQLREHVGLVWYERECFVPLTWRDRRVVLFVGSANHHASVWLTCLGLIAIALLSGGTDLKSQTRLLNAKLKDDPY